MRLICWRPLNATSVASGLESCNARVVGAVSNRLPSTAFYSPRGGYNNVLFAHVDSLSCMVWEYPSLLISGHGFDSRHHHFLFSFCATYLRSVNLIRFINLVLSNRLFKYGWVSSNDSDLFDSLVLSRL